MRALLLAATFMSASAQAAPVVYSGSLSGATVSPAAYCDDLLDKTVYSVSAYQMPGQGRSYVLTFASANAQAFLDTLALSMAAAADGANAYSGSTTFSNANLAATAQISPDLLYTYLTLSWVDDDSAARCTETATLVATPSPGDTALQTTEERRDGGAEGF